MEKSNASKFIILGKGHYLKDGTMWNGNKHVMPNGQVHTGKIHNTSCKHLYNFVDLNETAQTKTKVKN